MLTAGMVIALGPLSIDLYLPSLPAIQREFAATQGQIQATMATYLVGLAFGQLLYGPTSDAFGRKRPMMIGLLLYLVGVTGCALSDDAGSLAAWRLLQALGGCAGSVIVRAMIRDRFETQDVARALSTLTLVMGVAPIVAPVIGGWLYQQFGWRSTFWSLVGFAVIASAAFWFGMPETRPDAPERLSFGSLWRSYGRMLRHRRFMGYAVAGAVAQAGLFAYIACAPFVFTQIYGIAEHRVGWLFAITGSSYIVGSQVNRALLQTRRAEALMRASLHAYLVFTAALVVVVLLHWASLPVLMALLACTVFSMGFTFPNSTAVALAPFGDRAGLAASLMGMLQFVFAGALSYALGHLAVRSALPMAAAMLACAVGGQLALRWLVKRTRVALPVGG